MLAFLRIMEELFKDFCWYEGRKIGLLDAHIINKVSEGCAGCYYISWNQYFKYHFNPNLKNKLALYKECCFPLHNVSNIFILLKSIFFLSDLKWSILIRSERSAEEDYFDFEKRSEGIVLYLLATKLLFYSSNTIHRYIFTIFNQRNQIFIHFYTHSSDHSTIFFIIV